MNYCLLYAARSYAAEPVRELIYRNILGGHIAMDLAMR
jgi:hypothetical protein